MTRQLVTISFERADVQPPVFIYGAFTCWKPYPMKAIPKTAVHDEDPEKFMFVFECGMEPGRWAYKFRLSNGLWACDEHAPKGRERQTSPP